MQEEESSMVPELFALDDESSCESTCSLTRSAGSIDTVDYDSLDQCLDAHSLARSIQSLKVPDTNKRQRVGIAPSDLRPMAHEHSARETQTCDDPRSTRQWGIRDYCHEGLSEEPSDTHHEY